MTVTPGSLFRAALTGEGRGFALTGATVLLMVHALAEAAIPVLIGVVVDRAIMPGDTAALFTWLGALLGVFIVLTASYQSASRLMVTVYGRGEQTLRHRALQQILRPRLTATRLTAGEALTYVTSDTYRVAGVAWSVAQQSAAVAAIVASALAMLVISPAATIVVFASTLIMMFVMRFVSRPLERRGMAEQHEATGAGAVAADFMTGFRVLVGMNARDEAVKRYVTASDRSRVAGTAAGRAIAGAGAVSESLAALTTAGLAGMSAWFASAGQISIGELVTVLGLAQFVSGYLAYAGSFPANWAHKLASAKRLAGLMNAPDLIEQPASPSEQQLHSAAVLTFRNGDERIELFSGERLGIRPRTTAEAREASRVLGLRAPVGPGDLTVAVSDGAAEGRHVDARDLEPDEYRSRVVSMPHRHMIMSGSLREAVTGSFAAAHEPEPREPDAAIIDAAHLAEVVPELGGWEAPVGEAGRKLSGGQRQRIGLARGLHERARVLVVDEPTSAVDAVTETEIAAKLRERQDTLVVISSSETMLAACDRVIEWRGAGGDSSETGQEAANHG